jgi:trimeric autotransporter adhesin
MTAIVRRPSWPVALVWLLLGLGLAGPAANAQQRVGVDSAVNPAAMGVPPGGLPRRLVLGQDVVFNERITTEVAGQTQILFVDESTLSVGPNANLLIDQFVYNPNAGTGRLVASLARGVFRFVGGKLSKQDNAVTMRTPAATIGIRGGVMLVRVGSNCAAAAALPSAGCNALEVIFVYGRGITITGLNGVSQTITRPGFEVTVARPGAAPSDPSPAPPGATASLLAQVDGRAGGNGGAPAVPTEIMVTSSGIANAISANVAASIAVSARTQPPAAQPQNVTPVVQQTQLNDQNVSVPGATVTPVGGGPSVTIAQFPNLPPGTPIFPPPVPPIPPIPPAPPIPSINIAGVAGGFFDTGNQGTALGFSGSLSAYAGGSVVDGTFTANGPFGLVTFPLAAGTATLAASGAGTTSPLGPVTGTTYVSPDNTFFYADLTPVDQPAQREFVYGGTPVNPTVYQATATAPSYLAFNVEPDAALQSTIPFIRQETGGSLGSAATISPLILATPLNSTFVNGTAGTKALQASLAIVGSQQNQSSVIVVLVGNVLDASLNGINPAQPVLNGIIHGSYLANATGQPIRIYSPSVTPADANGNSFYGATGISGLVLSNGNCCGPGELPSKAYETNTGTQAVTNYQFAQPATATSVPQMVATSPQTTRTLTGWFGGIMTKEPTPGTTAAPIPYVLTGSTSISTNAANLQLAANLTGSDPFAATSNSGIKAVNLGFGSTATGATNARIAFINDNLFAALENPGSPSTVNGITVPVTDGNSGSNIYLVTGSAAAPTALLPNGLCSACQYLQWGYWGGELDTPASGANAARVDVGHINSWVAGILTSAGDISSLKGANFTGNYAGNLFGTVINNGAQYLASGGLSAVYHFGTGTGSFSVVNYDGLSFTSNGSAALSGSNYTFALKVPGVAGAISGSFYGPMAAETGGNFAFSKTVGSPYFTSGVFAAKR